MEYPRRGEISCMDFPATGRGEMAGPHPALIVQNDVGNQASRLAILAAITSNPRVAQLSVGVRMTPRESGLPRPSVLHLGHLYTVDERRLGGRVGGLPQEKLRQVNRAIEASLGLKSVAL